ncbi:hypothetical protein [Streptomyces sp. DASNCL29]|uniref:hypothetical protein n=1 Tax=Streptomyces sp. DASNCL29 TaxID=2583819 RepID=UPI00110FCD42|nr:hypothetical protein [Streptomyces sp. DASNCL29]TMV00036.1 hypothetical protein FGK60_21790 [Streptomyces sp. DASNCL29]
MGMQHYGRNPQGESESYAAEAGLGAEEYPGEYEGQGAEAEFGTETYVPSESYAAEAGFGAEAYPGEGAYAVQGAEAEFGNASEQSGGYPQESHAYAESNVPSLENPLSEADEAQLAAELMEITSEDELEQFLGKMLRTVARGVGGFLRSPVGRSLGGIVKNVAKAALPVAGGALGTFIAPGMGTALGGRLGSMASNLFEVEAESADREEYEFEVGRRFVRLAATAAGNAALDPRTAASPQALARDAVLSAARRHAPGVARRFRAFAQPAPWYWPAPVPNSVSGGNRAVDGAPSGTQVPGRARSGRWVRQGRKIVLLGV